MGSWTRFLSEHRVGRGHRAAGPTRTSFQQDADLVVFSAAFRRLQDKTQVHPLSDNDHVRTRLTHSIEVASVGRSLGTLAAQTLARRGLLDEDRAYALPHAVFAACLAHDIGNPPFGHGGEDAIRAWFSEHPDALRGLDEGQRADLLCFEGNAQGLRCLTRLENYRDAGGLRLTAATLGAFMKYTVRAQQADRGHSYVARRKPGYHGSEAQAVAELRQATGLEPGQRHPLAYLTEAADDICYAIIDVEDGFGLGLIDFDAAASHLARVSGAAVDPEQGERECIQKLRGIAIGVLVEAVGAAFAELEPALRAGEEVPPLLEATPHAQALEACKGLARRRLFGAPEVAAQQAEGRRALHGLLGWLVPVVDALEAAAFQPRGLPGWAAERVARLGRGYRPRARYDALLGVLDYVAGMTDRYAVRLHRRVAAGPEGAR